MGLLQTFNEIMESVDMDIVDHESVEIPLVRGFEKEQLANQ
jgi:hypothetical protein